MSKKVTYQIRKVGDRYYVFAVSSEKIGSYKSKSEAELVVERLKPEGGMSDGPIRH